MAVFLSPIGNDAPFVDANGNPLSGGKLYTYAAGSATPLATYTTDAGNVANANPIILNSNGYPASGGNVVEIWLSGGSSYLFELQTAASVVVWSRDDISGVNDVSVAISEWVAGSAPTFVSTTSFTVAGDQTTVYNAGRRTKTTNSGGTIYSTIVSSSYDGASTTTVVVRNDAGVLDSGLSALAYALLSGTNPSVPLIVDSYPLRAGSSDNTKRARLELDSITTATERTLTVPNANVVISFPKGYLFGCKLSNNVGDATNDIDFATGQATDSTGAIDIVAASALTKQLDVAWAAGNNAGGRMSAAAITDTTYHCYIIRKDSDGTADFGFDTSATAPTMPAGYTYFRRIGSIVRASAAIRGFVQYGDEFYWKVPPALDVDVTNPGTTAVSRTLAVPLGIQVKAVFNATTSSTGSTHTVYFSSLDTTDVAGSQTASPLGSIQVSATGGAETKSATVECWTNTSAQIRSIFSSSGAGDVLKMATIGWKDNRGRIE